MILRRKNQLNNQNQDYVQEKTTGKSMLRNSFLTAGVFFTLICVLAIAVRFILAATGISLQGNRFNTQFWDTSFSSTRMVLFVFGSVLMIISFVLTIIWAYRVERASRMFIYINYIAYGVAQGIGLGVLFVLFNAFELVSIFGIAGGLFLTMGIIGFFIKDGTRLIPYIIGGSILVLVLSLISLILFWTKVYSDTLIMFLLVLSGVMFLLYTVFDIWMIRRTSEYQAMTGNFDKEMQFRLVAWFGFRLTSDMIALIWSIARFWLVASN